jgi:hypothetical protein
VAQGGADLSGRDILYGYTLVIPQNQSATLTGRTDLYTGSVLDNQGTLTVSNGLLDCDSSAALLQNEGALHTNQDSSLVVPINSTGAISVDSGSLQLGEFNSTFAGPIDATNATSLQFSGAVTLTSTSSVDATAVTFTDTTQVACSYNASSTTVFHDIVTVTGTVEALGALNADGGQLDLFGATLAPGSTTLPSLTLTNNSYLEAAADWTVSGPVSLDGGRLYAGSGVGSLVAQGGADLSGRDILYGYTLVIPQDQSATLTGRTDLYTGSVLDN